MSQTVGHLDFFPNGGKDMPGCQKNILSQIVDIEGIWEGTATTCMKRFFLGENTCCVLLNLLNILVLYKSHIFYNKGLLIVSPRYRLFIGERWHEKTVGKKMYL